MDFPVASPPPKSRFWPKTAQKKRKRDLRDAHVARRLVGLVPHLDREEFRPVILSFARVSNLTTDVYKFLRKSGLVNPETGEIRVSVGTLTKLLQTQLKFAGALGLLPTSPSMRAPKRVGDFAAALTYGDGEDGGREPVEVKGLTQAEVEGDED
jgi:hypothetical protein